jgi:3-hydroxyisobutyrate dehydrogenase-like beta-hydroxyacid dehydrogenase
MITVAVLGAGRMGAAMARTLARTGCSLVVYNRTSERASALSREVGARIAATPAEAASLADVSLCSVTDAAAVDELFGATDGVLAGARSGSVLVDMSTVAPSTIRSYRERAEARGIGLLDAPVSGSVALADAGQLTIMVGGDANDLERAMPALEPLAKAIHHVGPLGSGAAMKLAVNTLIFGLNTALAEGLVLAEAAGIDRARAYDVLASSAAGAPFVQYKRAAFVDPDETPPAFSLDLAAKDLDLILALAGSCGVPMPQTEINLDLVNEARENGRGALDFATVAEALRRRRHTLPV